MKNKSKLIFIFFINLFYLFLKKVFLPVFKEFNHKFYQCNSFIKGKLYFNLILICLIFIVSFNINPVSNNIGVTRLFSNFKKINPDFHLKIEDAYISSISTMSINNKYALNLNKSSASLKNFFSEWKKIKDLTDDMINFNKNNSEIIDELKNVDTLIAGEIIEFNQFEEKDFYDTNLILYNLKFKIKILVIDLAKKIITDENDIEIELYSKKNFDDAKNLAINNFSRKLNNYFSEIDNLKEEIRPTKIGVLFVWLDKGQDVGLKSGNILVYNKTTNYETVEHTVIQIVRVYENKSIANILYTQGDLTEDAIFTKISKMNIELDLIGGITLTDLDKSNINFVPQAGLKLLIPVGIVYFNPVVQLDFNFFYKKSTILFPFSFETGIQGKFNIHRFEFAIGTLVGVLFSPDESNNYKIDTAIIRPYLHIDGIINTSFNIFGECGYKYFIDDNFSKNWKTNLTGLYFTFGFGIVF